MKLTIANARSSSSVATSLQEGTNLFINIVENDSDESALDTSTAVKKAVMRSYLKKDKKLSMRDIAELTDAFEKGEKTLNNPKLDRKYDDALEFVDESLKKFLTYPEDTKLFPVIDVSKPFSLYITGMRASGKSFFVREFLKHNKPKDAIVVLISPFTDDPSLKGLKYVKFDLPELDEMLERPFTVFDFPEDAIVVYDDCCGFNDRTQRKRVEELRDACLTVGRHHGKRGLSVISIEHNPMAGNVTKTSLRESGYFVLFPKTNPRDVKVLLKAYAGYTEEQITEILDTKSRYVFVSKTIPSYWVSSSQVRLNVR